MSKIDYKSIFGKSVDDNYQELVNRLTMFFDKNIFEVKGNSYEGYHKLINGLTYILRQDMDESAMSIFTQIDGSTIKHTKSGSNVELDRFLSIVDNISNLYKRRNVKAADGEHETVTQISPAYFMSFEDAISITKNLPGSDSGDAQKMIHSLENCEFRNELVGVYMPAISTGSSSSSNQLVMFFKLDNSDSMVNTKYNYYDSLIYTLPISTLYMVLALLMAKYKDHLPFTSEELWQLLIDNDVVISYDSDCAILNMIRFSFVFTYLVTFLGKAANDCTDPDTGDVDWDRFAEMTSIDNIQKYVIDPISKILADNLLCLRFTEFTFDDEKMEVMNFKDYYNKRRAIQHPTATYDSEELEQLYSICGITLYVDGWRRTTDPDTGIIVHEPDIESKPTPSCILPLKEYKEYISRIRKQIEAKYPIPDQEPYDGDDEDYIYSDTHNWEEGFDYFIKKYGINEDSSYVIFEPHGPIDGSIYITDLFNKELKVNTTVENWDTFANKLREEGAPESYITAMYEYIFENTYGDVRKSNDPKYPDDEQLAEFTNTKDTRTIACFMYQMWNGVQDLNPEPDLYIMYPRHALIEPLYDGNSFSRYQIYNILEDEHVILDNCSEIIK